MGCVLFVACTNVGQAMIDAIYHTPGIRSEVVGIVNLNAGRGLSKANYRPYLDISEKYRIPLHFCDNVNDPVTMEWIAEKAPDLIIQSGWSQKFRNALLELPRYGCIGEHPAPLPKGRGAACVNWAILSGETQWGDTFFRMVEQYDRGEVYAQEFFDIQEYDTVKTVYDKVANCAGNIIKANLDQWSGGQFQAIPLDETKATYYGRRTPADGVFVFDRPAPELHNFIRAQTDPYPGAFFMWNGEKITVLASRNCREPHTSPVGEILGRTENGGILVACGGGTVLELLRCRHEDGTLAWFAEEPRFAPGATLQ